MGDVDKSPLMKDGLGPHAINRMANSIALVVPGFDAKSFQQEAIHGLDQLELKARVHHMIAVLHRHYDLPFNQLCVYLQDLPAVWDRGSAADNKAGFAAWPLIDYVAVHGLQHPDEALQILEKLTPLFSAEFSIRPFIYQHPELTYKKLISWCEHPSEHVRRLASEGSRPRLPWGMRLPGFINNPEPLIGILEKLKTDESLYVRRSVANNLNDISKDNPEWMLNICERWLVNSHKHTAWIVKHALRSLIKAGNTRAFSLLGYAAQPTVAISKIELDKQNIMLGDSIRFSCAITNTQEAQNLVIDYVVYFMKANGKLAPKVFKLRNILIAANETISITKKHSFKPITTRRYYSGKHQIAIQINGKEITRLDFYVGEQMQ